MAHKTSSHHTVAGPTCTVVNVARHNDRHTRGAPTTFSNAFSNTDTSSLLHAVNKRALYARSFRKTPSGSAIGAAHRTERAHPTHRPPHSPNPTHSFLFRLFNSPSPCLGVFRKEANTPLLYYFRARLMTDSECLDQASTPLKFVVQDMRQQMEHTSTWRRSQT